jgi:hypothetical protein
MHLIAAPFPIAVVIHGSPIALWHFSASAILLLWAKAEAFKPRQAYALKTEAHKIAMLAFRKHMNFLRLVS